MIIMFADKTPNDSSKNVTNRLSIPCVLCLRPIAADPFYAFLDGAAAQRA